MKIFQCGNCYHPLYFENYNCGVCGQLTGYRDVDGVMLTFNSSNGTLISEREGKEYKYCKNHQHEVCNWIIEKNDFNNYCRACQLNRMIPNLSEKKNFEKWKHLELAKHRLIYQLQKIGLDLPSKLRNESGLCFDFVAKHDNPELMTGHENGVITILLREADSVLREQMRKLLFEPYRTLIGHLRHEVGHYFWEVLVWNDQKVLKEYREVFGDESISYADSLRTYYANGAPYNWQETHISRYATAHSWEDWAETWAHYLHVMDMVETAYFFRLNVSPVEEGPGISISASYDPYMIQDFDEIIKTCVPLAFAVNSMNRAMGIPDVYPFEISPAVVVKMKFIHHLLMEKRNSLN